MLIKIMGVLDILAAAAVFLSLIISSMPVSIIVILGVLILIKGIMFALIMDFASILDVLSGIIMLISAGIATPAVIMVIVGIYLAQKGILSLFA